MFLMMNYVILQLFLIILILVTLGLLNNILGAYLIIIVKQQVADMLGKGVIQSSTSLWASPVVLVKKKDGSFRFCVNYRKLNTVTKQDAHLLPRVDDLLNSLNHNKYFSTLDLCSGYWQVSMSPQDREKTAFMTPEGLFEFMRMPYGLSTAPATFAGAVNIILSGLTYDMSLLF